MNTNRYSLAAWASVASVLVFVPEIIFTFIYDAGFSAGAQGPAAALLLIKTALSAYALYRLRDYLNERFEFHEGCCSPWQPPPPGPGPVRWPPGSR